eukprot:scaffold33146_cov63-Cyclotella_meneghiniana.AAC.4
MQTIAISDFASNGIKSNGVTDSRKYTRYLSIAGIVVILDSDTIASDEDEVVREQEKVRILSREVGQWGGGGRPLAAAATPYYWLALVPRLETGTIEKIDKYQIIPQFCRG